MITAKDDFTLEREMMQELYNMAYRANMSQEEMESFFDGVEGITEQGFQELKQKLAGRELSPLERIKNGETLKASEINEAVRKAANSD
jgi:hypothetical protein